MPTFNIALRSAGWLEVDTIRTNAREIRSAANQAERAFAGSAWILTYNKSRPKLAK